MRPVKVEEMELLVRVAETGSMSRAAQQLHLTPAAISAAVQRIEQSVGVRVFERTTRSLRPTAEGQVVIEGCRNVVDVWQRTLDEARGHRSDLEGTVHLSAPTDTTYHIIESVLVDLCAANPRLRVIVDPSDIVKDIHRNAIDIAIRYGRLDDSTLRARKLAECPALLVAAPSYVAEFGAPESPESLCQHRCLTLQLSNMPVSSWTLYDERGSAHELSFESPLCGDGYLTRRWALAGLGITLKSLFDVIDDLEAGRLVQILPAYLGRPYAIHAVFPSRQFQTARVRSVHAAIEAHLAPRVARCQTWLDRRKANAAHRAKRA